MNLDITEYKLFSVLLSIFYISAVVVALCHLEIVGIIIAFLFLSFLILIFNYPYKRVLILCFFFLFGLLRVNFLAHDNFIEGIKNDEAEIYGQIVSSKDISKTNKRIRFYANVSRLKIDERFWEDLNSKVLIYLDLDEKLLNNIIIGDSFYIKGKLRPPYPASNPHQFDYKKYLSNNDTYNILYGDNSTFKKTKEVKFLSSSLNDKFYYILKQFELMRIKIIEKHSKNIKSPKLEILGGIVFGSETISPDENIKESFKNSGLLHLLAASGLNVALIFGIWWWISNIFKLPYQPSILIGAIFVILYTFMTGFPPSILRAGLMLLFVLFGKLINRDTDSFALVCFVAFLILIVSPKMIFDIGFELSFVVTIGLVLCCNTIISKFEKSDDNFKRKYKKLTRFQKYFFFLLSPKSLAGILSVPLVAQIWVIPLQMHYFNTLNPLSIFANIAVVPFIGILSFIGFIGSIIALIPNLSDFVIKFFDCLANPLLSLLIKIGEFFSSFKISHLSSFGLNIFQIFIYWIFVLGFILNLKYNFKNKKHILIMLSCFAVFLLSFVNFNFLFNKNLEIMMFDVGNADSFLIKTPKNKYILIDTGKKSFRGISSGEIIINKFLKNEKINSLKALIITHFDSDHCGGSLDILQNEKVETVYIQKDEAKSLLSSSILNFLKENKLNYKIARNNKIIYSEKDLTIKTFKAAFEDSNKDRVDNETSIITLLTYKNKNILFMADAGTEAFNQIKDNLPDKINILKAGHHGAINSVDFDMLERIKPEIALISTGVNKFNHPYPKTISLLDEKNIKTISSKNYGFTKIILKPIQS